MDRHSGYKDIPFKECINSNLKKYRIRWDYKLSESDEGMVTFVEKEYLYDPSIEEVKRDIIDWYKSDVNKDEFYIDGHKLWCSSLERSSMRVKYELHSGIVNLYASDYTLQTDSKIALEIINRMDLYDEACNEFKRSVINQIESSESIEEINAIDMYSGFPESSYNTQDEISDYIDYKDNSSVETQAVAFSRMVVNIPAIASSMSANDSLRIQMLYPVWGEEFAELGKNVTVGFKFNYKDGDEYTLYEVIQEHALSDNWRPGVGTESLYKVVQEEHAGTEADPIPWKWNMELEEGLYYIDNGIIYRCIRNSDQGMSFDLADLVSSGYVEIVS